MTLLADSGAIEARKPVVAGPLRALAASLAADLSLVMQRALFIPEGKALLSREGGRCPRDGAQLDFDPFSPHEHRCPQCGEVYRGDLHDAFWVYWYQLWLAERAVHAALLGRLGVVTEAQPFAARILDGYADRYLRYPNVDNALGPSRPFFSTYLESIWLLQLCVAADLLPEAHRASVDRFRDCVVEPSLELIASFDEGLSNRQVWNNAALIAGNGLVGRNARVEETVWAASGVVTHLSSALLPDGTWYEGENYHFFAHRGLWYCMELVSRIDSGIPAELVDRYVAGFRAPFLTALPDLTFPSRRDSQYAVSLRQWRFAEMCELGLARGDHRILRSMLARLYANDIPPGDTGRWKSTAEAERNQPASRLDRACLGWKSLLCARPSLALTEPAPLPSVLLDAQGIAVIRREVGRVYVALDYGASGGGHGHPDRLNLMVSDGTRRILDDMGTGSYVDPSLHWYRSTLAHNAPMFDGVSQMRRDGQLIAFEDRGAAGWMSARAAIADGAEAIRTVVVMPDYLIDEVRWTANAPRVFDLPLHLDVASAEVRADAAPGGLRLAGSDAREDGFRFLRNARCIGRVAPGRDAQLTWPDLQVTLAADTDVELWSAVAPAAPGHGDRSLMILRARSATGTIRWMTSWAPAPRARSLFPQPVIETGVERHEHARMEHGWQVAIHVGPARSTIDLEGLVPAHDAAAGKASREPDAESVLMRGAALHDGQPEEFLLGRDHYRRSEETWIEAGSPSARVTMQRAGEVVHVHLVVNAGRTFVPPGAVNPLDNEPADINGAGVQLYLIAEGRGAGYVIVPREGGHELAFRSIDGWAAGIPVEGSWQPSGDGYEIDLRFRPGERVFLFDLIVNEKPPGRQRRRGQLVLSGGHDESIYLRGDRHDPSRMIPFLMSDD